MFAIIAAFVSSTFLLIAVLLSLVIKGYKVDRRMHKNYRKNN